MAASSSHVVDDYHQAEVEQPEGRPKTLKRKKSEVEKPKKWSWKEEFVEALIKEIKDYKTVCDFNAVDFEADLKELYTEVHCRLALRFPVEFGPDKVHHIPKLSEEQKRACEGKISLEECSCLLDSFRDNKTPGNDGISIEFYKRFWPLIGDSFIRCANECFEKGELSCSQKQAVITLIEKKGKDRSLLENWRPISLVNVDTKIMSKVIASRIKNVLPEIIHHNKTGYVKDRFIGETISSIYDVMDYTVEENIPGLMIFIDFKKAFGIVEWDFLLKCLEAFNFVPDFIRWVKTFYKTDIQSCTINNGTASQYFTLERGVRQGDPLSPYLFILVVETLAIAIRQNKSIKGIMIENEETKLLQYADDTTAVLSDINSAETLFELLDSFKAISGNCTKTEGMWSGSSKENKTKPFGIKWPNEPIKALGVFFTYDQKLLKEKNFI
ncbi:hypothetical protein ACROYT_G013691 [Oculina patagonica]